MVNFFKKIFKIDNKWEYEVTKVFNSRNDYYLNNNFYPGKLWGLDECYASDCISVFENQDIIEYLDFFWEFWHKKRLDCQHQSMLQMDYNLVEQGYYSEITCKQIDFNKKRIEEIISRIPKYTV